MMKVTPDTMFHDGHYGLFGKQKEVFDSWELSSTGIMGSLPHSAEGHRFLAVTTDYHSKFVVAKSLRDGTSQAVARHIAEDVFPDI